MKLGENFLAMDYAEQLVCRSVVQLFSCIGINVAHHKINIILCQVIKGRSFWNNPTDHLMSYFTGSLLVRTLRITKKDASSKLTG